MILCAPRAVAVVEAIAKFVLADLTRGGFAPNDKAHKFEVMLRDSPTLNSSPK